MLLHEPIDAEVITLKRKSAQRECPQALASERGRTNSDNCTRPNNCLRALPKQTLGTLRSQCFNSRYSAAKVTRYFSKPILCHLGCRINRVLKKQEKVSRDNLRLAAQ
jgi:hypothetical protein